MLVYAVCLLLCWCCVSVKRGVMCDSSLCRQVDWRLGSDDVLVNQCEGRAKAQTDKSIQAQRYSRQSSQEMLRGACKLN